MRFILLITSIFLLLSCNPKEHKFEDINKADNSENATEKPEVIQTISEQVPSEFIEYFEDIFPIVDNRYIILGEFFDFDTRLFSEPVYRRIQSHISNIGLATYGVGVKLTNEMIRNYLIDIPISLFTNLNEEIHLSNLYVAKAYVPYNPNQYIDPETDEEYSDTAEQLRSVVINDTRTNFYLIAEIQENVSEATFVVTDYPKNIINCQVNKTLLTNTEEKSEIIDLIVETSEVQEFLTEYPETINEFRYSNIFIYNIKDPRLEYNYILSKISIGNPYGGPYFYAGKFLIKETHDKMEIVNDIINASNPTAVFDLDGDMNYEIIDESGWHSLFSVRSQTFSDYYIKIINHSGEWAI